MRKLVFFCYSAWLLCIAALIVGIWLMYHGIPLEQPLEIIGGLCSIVLVPFILHIAGGFTIINTNDIMVKQTLFRKPYMVSKEEIREIIICQREFNSKRREYQLANVIKANSNKGIILGCGGNTLRVLIKTLNVPVDFKEPNMSCLLNVKLLLQKGPLTRVKAERLKEKFHLSQKFFDKYYVEPNNNTISN